MAGGLQRAIGLVFALLVGVTIASFAYQRIMDPEPKRQRAREEAAVLAARGILERHLGLSQGLEIVDPLNPNRAIGKTYVYPAAKGWEISGYYRRGEASRWHPWLMTVDEAGRLVLLSIRERSPALEQAAAADSRLTIVPE